MSKLKKTRGREKPSKNVKRARFPSSLLEVNSWSLKLKNQDIAAFTCRNMDRNNRGNSQNGVRIQGRTQQTAVYSKLCMTLILKIKQN